MSLNNLFSISITSDLRKITERQHPCVIIKTIQIPKNKEENTRIE
jgi:hypothetical protein